MNSSYAAYSTMLTAEKITVIFSDKVSTARFNFQSREITLPTYEYLDENEKMMLVSHEIGHAKYSKYDPEDVLRFKKEFGPLFNVIEDIRVEASMKREYPGLKEVFSSGYKDLFNHNFFKIGNRKSEDFHFFDRINLFFKIGHVYNVEFSPEESDIIRKCFNLSSNEDVINLCRELMAKEEEKNSEQNEESNSSDEIPDDSEEEYDDQSSNSDEGSSFEENESEEESEGTGNSSFEDSEEGLEGSNTEDSDEDSEEYESEEESEGAGNSSFNKESKEKQEYGETVEDFENSLQEAYDDYNDNEGTEESGNQYSRLYSRGIIGSIDIFTKDNPYNEVAFDGIDTVKTIVEYIRTNPNAFFKRVFKTMNNDILQLKKLSKNGDTYFQMLKNAAKAKNAKYKKTGTINTKSLYRYKTSENIFKHKQIFKNETNHGVVLFIDYSGSMKDQLNEVTSQAIIACEFCKRNNIKFEVYAFGVNRQKTEEEYNNAWSANSSSDVVKIADTNNYDPAYIWLFSSTFKKYAHRYYLKAKAEDEFLALLYRFGRQGYTPLIKTAFAAFHAVKRLKSLMCDKTHVILITDGDNTDEYCKMASCRMNFEISKGIDYVKGEAFSTEDCSFNTKIAPSKTSYININGIKYKMIAGARLHDCIISSVLTYIKDAFGTEITFSFINKEHDLTMDFINLVTMTIDPKINEKLQQDKTNNLLIYKPEGSFADTLIIKRDLYKIIEYAATKEDLLKKEIKYLYERANTYTVFVKELAKTIA